jgi:hypothetical protein
MPLTITREQRDAIYEVVLNHLTGIGDVWIAVQSRDFDYAQKLGRAFAEDLRLLDDLGWASECHTQTVTLTMPSDDLARAAARLQRRAADSLESYVSRPKDDEEIAERDVAASAAVGDLLGHLAGAWREGHGRTAVPDRSRHPPLLSPCATPTATGSS